MKMPDEETKTHSLIRSRQESWIAVAHQPKLTTLKIWSKLYIFFLKEA
jgi:hypothetical protein